MQPGTKVAETLTIRPDLMLVGKVMPDGNSVLWQEVVDQHGMGSNAHVQGVRPGKPVPLSGKEKPCPPEFAKYVN
ncbi:hypothetical protein [Deinococcus sp. UR1]|uniref:hypothetical protein n=1 Tax=Deinococcus sp. UR1 TaxID=1704277 RepID=UPI000C19C799|nr:hypothetical protein [Deinococcus sp. UR1]PIG96920.1 hypothetical protein AMD26_015455 [Deinococcus sp. UR1]